MGRDGRDEGDPCAHVGETSPLETPAVGTREGPWHVPHGFYELVCPITGPLVGKAAGVECTPRYFACCYSRPEVQSSPIHPMGNGPTSTASSASLGSFDTRRRAWGTHLPHAHTDSSWCLFAVCSHHVQAAPPGRRRQAGRSQLLQPGPPLRSRLLKAAGERCRYVLCLAVTTVLFETRQKPLCAESRPERVPWCVRSSSPPSDLLQEKEGAAHPSRLLLPPGCHETLFLLARGYGKCTSPF